jgi:hypothetical protein
MDISWDLLLNAIAAGLLLGGFYAAVTAGVSISFGMLDIVNIAHPGFVILGSYLAYFININFGVDPILVSILMLPVFYLLASTTDMSRPPISGPASISASSICRCACWCRAAPRWRCSARSNCSSPAPSPAARSWRCRRINWRCS